MNFVLVDTGSRCSGASYYHNSAEYSQEREAGFFHNDFCNSILQLY